ncbi:MAG: DUF2294 domain-containing protein [Synechococcales bacterium]|nr:DUF2294 domain-containing protein [Synechococcales bacterium]
MPTLNSENPDSPSLEEQVIAGMRSLYEHHLNHQPHPITCQILDGKIVILLEETVTRPEQILFENGQAHLAEQVRSHLDKILHPHIKELVERILQVPVIDILIDTGLDTRRTGTIIMLQSR